MELAFIAGSRRNPTTLVLYAWALTITLSKFIVNFVRQGISWSILTL